MSNGLTFILHLGSIIATVYLLQLYYRKGDKNARDAAIIGVVLTGLWMIKLMVTGNYYKLSDNSMSIFNYVYSGVWLIGGVTLISKIMKIR